MSAGQFSLQREAQPVSPVSPLTGGESILSVFVQAGIQHFAEQHLDQCDPVFSHIHNAAALAKCLGLPPRGFLELVNFLNQHPERLYLSAPLGRLIDGLNLSLAEIFVLGLCAELENSYFLNLALMALQAPEDNARPSLHLLVHLAYGLFGATLRPVDFVHHALVQSGLVRVEGSGPLPMRSVALDIELWQVLHNTDRLLPETQPLSHSDVQVLPEHVKKEIPQLSAMLRKQEARGIVFRGSHLVARSAGCEIALQLGLRPVRMEADAWQTNRRALLAARCAHWLPMVSLDLAPADRFVEASNSNIHSPEVNPSTTWWPLIITAGCAGSVEIDGLIEFEIGDTFLAQRQTLWQQHLHDMHLAEELAHSALLDASAIYTIAEKAKQHAQRQQRDISKGDIALVRRRLAGSQLRQLAHPIVQQVDKEALVLPVLIYEQFDRLLKRCKRRESLWQGLGLSASAASNFGVRVLFCGDSGTGKTLSASYLATHLGAPLYRLDLASVMNKYIGETEKNLGLLLDEAAASDTILLLDEADALFGKRTEGDSAGDRFANMLTNFLLTRIEHHPGIIILTSNNQSRIDSAFTRRLDVVIEFPSPNAQERYLIWRSHLGDRAPSERACQLLASYCDLPGGFIRNAVLNAAACEYSAGQALSVCALVDALKEEYRKLGRALPPSFDTLRAQHG